MALGPEPCQCAQHCLPFSDHLCHKFASLVNLNNLTEYSCTVCRSPTRLRPSVSCSLAMQRIVCRQPGFHETLFRLSLFFAGGIAKSFLFFEGVCITYWISFSPGLMISTSASMRRRFVRKSLLAPCSTPSYGFVCDNNLRSFHHLDTGFAQSLQQQDRFTVEVCAIY